MKSNYVYILIMALTTFLIRVLPLTLIRKQIKNKFLKSFLYYVPYITLSVMTFPAIMDVTGMPLAGLCALAVGVIASLLKGQLLTVACICCVVVLIFELFI